MHPRGGNFADCGHQWNSLILMVKLFCIYCIGSLGWVIDFGFYDPDLFSFPLFALSVC